MQEEVRTKIIRELDALGEHIKNGTVSKEIVDLYLGLLREAKTFMSPEEASRIHASRQNFRVNP